LCYIIQQFADAHVLQTDASHFSSTNGDGVVGDGAGSSSSSSTSSGGDGGVV
jgi:hypothetical protein